MNHILTTFNWLPWSWRSPTILMVPKHCRQCWSPSVREQVWRVQPRLCLLSPSSLIPPITFKISQTIWRGGKRFFAWIYSAENKYLNAILLIWNSLQVGYEQQCCVQRGALLVVRRQDQVGADGQQVGRQARDGDRGGQGEHGQKGKSIHLSLLTPPQVGCSSC